MNVEVRDSERTGPHDAFLGRLVGGRYRIDAVLGDGAAGRLYLAAQLPLERRVALRVLPPAEMSHEAAQRFAHEASIAGQLAHPNSVRLVDFGRTEQFAPFLAMEYVPGRTLADALKEGALEQVRAIHLAQQICRSLREAHAMSILHRGLRPTSVMLLRQQDEQDFVKVMDFGMPRASTTGELSRMPTAAAHYLAPEQARNQVLDPRCDVYALGAVLYEMLTGRPPFTGTCATDVIVRHLAEQPVVPRIVRPDLLIDASLERIVLRCLAKDRNARYASMDELLDALKLVRGQLTRVRGPYDTLPPVPAQPAIAAGPSPAPRFQSVADSLRPRPWRAALVLAGAAIAGLLFLAIN